jgi:hypothetical protein
LVAAVVTSADPALSSGEAAERASVTLASVIRAITKIFHFCLNPVLFYSMSNRRSNLFGVLAVLLALIAQLGTGASIPRVDPVAAAGVICHIADDSGGTPSDGPTHPADCPVCPLCATLHVQPTALVSEALVVTPPTLLAIRRSELPPPSTAPPATPRPPSQPRAPPILS